MNPDSFKALIVDERDGKTLSEIRSFTKSELPEGDVMVRVAYSSLNYKDGLAVTGRGKIIRRFPLVPGIDLAGTVEESASPSYKPGDPVVLTGWGIGEKHWGGYTQLNRVKSEWLIPLPSGLTAKQAMAVGTAGFTAMLSVMALEERGLKPGEKEVLVTGAAGGVGSTAVAILAKLGYKVAASTGRKETHDYLKSLGATTILDRAELTKPSSKPMESERWTGAVDSVGGETLASVIRSLASNGSVAACGLAGGVALNTTVFPFILRGVGLLGIDSAWCAKGRREAAWKRIVSDLPQALLEKMTQEIALAQVPEWSGKILAGDVRGRVVVNSNS